MKKITVENMEYELIIDYRDSYDQEDFESRFTDYFYDFDYIVGDYAYNKLRLKGFYDSKNPKCTKINNINNLDKYLKDNCAYGCKYFELKKVTKRD